MKLYLILPNEILETEIYGGFVGKNEYYFRIDTPVLQHKTLVGTIVLSYYPDYEEWKITQLQAFAYVDCGCNQVNVNEVVFDMP